MTNESMKDKDGLPQEAFALVGDRELAGTWHLPHHKKSILRALRGKADIEETVDWKQMAVAVETLASRRRLMAEVSPEAILLAATHMAGHYRHAGEPLPDILAALA